MLRIAVFIDGNNVFYACKKLGFSIDYGKLSDFLEKKYEKNGAQVVIRRFFTGALERPSENQKKFWQKLESIGYQVVKREIKNVTDHEGQHIKQKADMDATIGFDMADLQNQFDLLVLISGDGDYEKSLTTLSNRGKKIIVISIRSMVASELVDLSRPTHGNVEYIDLVQIKNSVQKIYQNGGGI